MALKRFRGALWAVAAAGVFHARAADTPPDSDAEWRYAAAIGRRFDWDLAERYLVHASGGKPSPYDRGNLMFQRAQAEPDASRRRELSREALDLLRRSPGAWTDDSPAAQVAWLERTLGVVKALKDAAEQAAQARSENPSPLFDEALKLLSTVSDRLEEVQARGALEAALYRLHQKKWLFKGHLLLSRLQHETLSPEKRYAAVQEAEEAFAECGFLANPAESDRMPYPWPALWIARCRRLSGDRAGALKALADLWKKKVPADQRGALQEALGEEVEILLELEKYDEASEALRAHGALADDRSAPFRERFRFLEGRLWGDRALRSRDKNLGGWQAEFDRGWGRLTEIARKGGPLAPQASVWLKRWAAVSGRRMEAVAYSWKRSADEALSEGRYADAIRLYRSDLVAGTAANVSDAWRRIAFCHAQQGNFWQAALAYGEEARSPGLPADRKAKSLLNAWGELGKAVNALETAAPDERRRILDQVGGVWVRRLAEEHADDPEVRKSNFAIYWADLLVRQGKLREALDVYRGIPQGHPARAEAMRKAAFTAYQRYAEAGKTPEAPRRDELRTEASELLDRYLDSAAREGGGASGEWISQAAYLSAYLHAADAPARALKLLDGFEKRFPEAPPEARADLPRLRSLAFAALDDLGGARSAWASQAAALPAGEKPPPRVLAAARQLARMGQKSAEKRREAGDADGEKQWKGWASDLLGFTFKWESRTFDEWENLLRYRFEAQKDAEGVSELGGYLSQMVNEGKVAVPSDEKGQRRWLYLQAEVIAPAHEAAGAWAEATDLYVRVARRIEGEGQGFPRWVYERIAETAGKAGRRELEEKTWNDLWSREQALWLQAHGDRPGDPFGPAWWRYAAGLLDAWRRGNRLSNVRDFMKEYGDRDPTFGGSEARRRIAAVCLGALGAAKGDEAASLSQILETMERKAWEEEGDDVATLGH